MTYYSFQVQLDDCLFLKGSQITEREIYISSQGSLGALEYERNQDRVQELVTIKVKKKIGDDDYDFFSPPYSTSVEDLRIRIEFFKSVFVYHKPENPREYYFEIDY